MKSISLVCLIISVSALSAQYALADSKDTTDNNKTTVKTQQYNDSWLGVWSGDIPVFLGNHLLPVLKKDQGIIVTKVSPDSPAAKAGIQVYDIIAKVNNETIFSQQQLSRIIRSIAPDTAVELTLVRQGKLITQQVIIKQRPGRRTMAKRFNPYSRHSFAYPDFHKHWSDPFMNKPFFQPDSADKFEQRMHQDMNNLRQEMTRLQLQFNNSAPKNSNKQVNHWFQFESIQVNSIGDNKHRAAIKYTNSEGINKEFVFEGKLEDIKTQIKAQKDMEDDKKQQLLQALRIN